MEWVVQAAPLPCRTSLRIVGRVWCRIRLWLRPWSTFHMCPIELDSVQLVTDVYPLNVKVIYWGACGAHVTPVKSVQQATSRFEHVTTASPEDTTACYIGHAENDRDATMV